MQFINLVDTALESIDLTISFIRRYANLRDILSILCWVIGHVIDILSSRRAIRVYTRVILAIVAFVRGFIYCCNCAIESGRIVAEGYYGIDEVIESEIDTVAGEQLSLPYTPVIGLLPAAPEPAPVALITPPPADYEFINKLCAIDSDDSLFNRLYALEELPIRTLRLVCSLEGFTGASRFNKETAIDKLLTIA